MEKKITKTTQLPLIPETKDFKKRYQHGGALLEGKRKSARPISTNNAMHFVLRSSHATGKQSFTQKKHHQKIINVIHSQSDYFDIELYHVLVNSNHIHLLVKLKSRLTWKRWLRAMSGIIARIVLEAERGHASGTKFWDARPWSRIVVLGRDFSTTDDYVQQNFLETWGFIPD